MLTLSITYGQHPICLGPEPFYSYHHPSPYLCANSGPSTHLFANSGNSELHPSGPNPMDNPPIHAILHPGHPLPSNGTQPPTIHIHRLKGHSVRFIAKPIQSMSPMLPEVAHGGLNFSWWYDKISYAPVPSTVRPFCRQAKSDFHWPIGHFCSAG